MQGFIIMALDDGQRIYELPKTPITIGSSSSSTLRIVGEGLEAGYATLTWDPGLATWILARQGSNQEPIRVNGRQLGTRAEAMADYDRLELRDLVLEFRRIPAPPIFRGQLVASIPVRPGEGPLVFGRSSSLSPDQGVFLDSEDPDVSPVHLTIESAGKAAGFVVTDQSQAGSLLNGRNFQKERLIIGDRFRVGAYNFEYTGYSIKRVSGVAGGRLEARGVTKEIRDRSGGGWKRILSEVDLDVGRCAFVGILGGSGQGKSTLLNALCGIIPPSAGKVFIEGVDTSSGLVKEAGIGFVPQDDIVHQELTVSQAITLSARLRLNSGIRSTEVAELVKRTMDRLGLSQFEDRRIYRLSGGQRKRVSIATELLSKPKVLFLDEPSSGLDPATEFKLMKLLRSLAGTDCTVVCTTHVLGRAYLFDQLCFIHRANLVFRGPGEKALEHFGVENLEDVYDILDESSQQGEEWRQSFETRYPDLICRAPVLPQPEQLDDGLEHGKGRNANFSHAISVLLERQRNILMADPLNLTFLVAQPLIIGALIGWVAENPVLRMFLGVVATLWFGCSNGAQQIVRELPIFRRERVSGLGVNAYLQSKYLFLSSVTAAQALILYVVILFSVQLVWDWLPGITNPDKAARQANAERTHERDTEFEENLLTHYFGVQLEKDRLPQATDQFLAVGTDPKDFAPAGANPIATTEPPRWREPLLRGGAGAIRAFADVTRIREPLEAALPKETGGHADDLVAVVAGTFGLRMLAFLAAALVGVAIGLTISAMVRTGTQAVMWVPLVLIPQILLGGFVITRAEMSESVRRLSAVVPSFAAQRIMDVSNVYGLTRPAMTNRTRIPLFVSGGDKDTVVWKERGKTYTAQYDRVSEQNVSWQNLLVIPSKVGQHRLQYRPKTNPKVLKETVDYRYDVVDFPEGTAYRFLGPVWTSLMVLFAWVGIGYGVTLWSLSEKEKSK